MKKQRSKYTRILSFIMAMLLCAVSIPMLAFSVSAQEDAVCLFNEDGVSVGSFISLTAAQQRAVDDRLNNYTIQLVDSITVDSAVKIKSTRASTWTLDGNGKSITQTGAGENALVFEGNAESCVTIKNLTVRAAGSCLLFDSGNYKVESGIYTTTDPQNWAAAAIMSNPKDLMNGNVKSSKVDIYGGAFYTYYHTETANDSKKVQACVSNNSFGYTKSDMNIYGGYFYSESAMTTAQNDCVAYNAESGSGEATLNIYGGTFEASNAKFCVTCNETAQINVYGGNFLASILNNSGSPNTQAVINLNKKGSGLNLYNANFAAGNSLVKIYKHVNGDQSPVNFSTDEMTPSDSYSYVFLYYAGPDKLQHYAVDGNARIPEMKTGAQIMLGTDKGSVKYTTTVSKAAIDGISALADQGTELNYGTIITGADLSAVRYLTKDSLDAVGAAYADITADTSKEFDTDGNLTFSAALTNIKSDYYNTKFNAISYIEAVINGVKVRFYGVYDGKGNAMSVKDLASAAVADTLDASSGDYTNLLDGGKYSPYTQEDIDLLKTFIVQ